MNDLNTKLMQEQQKGEQQASIMLQLNGQLQDTIKEFKVRLTERHCLTIIKKFTYHF